MFVNDVTTSADHQLNQILHTLKHVHGINITFEESTFEEIEALRESSEIIKNSIVNECAFNSYHTDPAYAKHMLILEAVRLYLREIAPRRRPRHLREGAEHNGPSAPTLGRWMMDFAERARTKDDDLLAMLNSFGRVGEDLTSLGGAFEKKTLGDLIDGYKARAMDEMNDEFDRKQAKDNLTALRLALKLYKKHHHHDADEAVDEEQIMEKVHMTPELEHLMKKYGVIGHDHEDDAEMDEGNEFSGALAAARAAGKDSFQVGGKTYNVTETMQMLRDIKTKRLAEGHHMQAHDYQASMARSELYRNVKYGMDMLKMIRPEDDVEPWIAACLTKSANYLDKIYHYMDYYTKFEPQELGQKPAMPSDEELDEDLGESTGSTARQNLMEIVEYSIKLFNMIQPGDKLEGWVAMKLTTASEGISSSKHFLDYKNFEQHAADRFGMHEAKSKRKLGESHFRRTFATMSSLIRMAPAAQRIPLAEMAMDTLAKLNSKVSRKKFYEASRVMVKEADGPEADLQQAQTLIAAKSISDDLQDMAEKVARMGVDDLMPLVDTMKSQFGPEAADGYNSVVKAAIENVLQSIQDAKDQSDNAVLALQGGAVPGMATDIEAAGDASAAAMAQPPMEPPAGDQLGTMPAAAGGDEPLGRAKKAPMAEGRSRIMLEVQDMEGAIVTLQNIIAGAGPATNAAGQPMHKIGDKDLTDLYKVINYLKNTQYNSSKAGANDIKEAWGTKMDTAEKDKGKWDGYTIAELKAKKKKLMDKESRTAAEQKTVKQIDFAIRAKQKNKWGSIKEETTHTKDERAEKAGRKVAKDIEYDEKKKDGIHGAKRGKEDDKAERAGRKVAKDIEHDEKMHEAKKAKPDFLDVDKDGDKKEPMKKALKDKAKKVAEAKKAKSPYAIGMWQAKKEAGMDPDSPASNLPKKIIKKAHEIARSIEKTDESIDKLASLLDKAETSKKVLEKQLSAHRRAFAESVAAGKDADLLKTGQGLEGDIISKKIAETTKMSDRLKAQISVIEAESLRKLNEAVDAERKAYRFAQAKAKAPWGVMLEDESGRDYKFFKDQQARDYWVQLNPNQSKALIGPEHFDIAVK